MTCQTCRALVSALVDGQCRDCAPDGAFQAAWEPERRDELAREYHQAEPRGRRIALEDMP